MKGLTNKQRAVYEFIRSQIVSMNRPPTIREIGKEFNLRSTGSVRDVLIALTKKGFIEKDPGLSRGIRVKAGPGPLAGEIVELPIIGMIVPGTSIEAYQNIKESLKVDKSMVPDGEIFAVKVKDDYMTRAGIKDGDYAFVRRQPTCRPGQIVAIRLDDEVVLKEFTKKGKNVRLTSKGREPEPIEVTLQEFSGMLLGILVAVYHRLK